MKKVLLLAMALMLPLMFAVPVSAQEKIVAKPVKMCACFEGEICKCDDCACAKFVSHTEAAPCEGGSCNVASGSCCGGAAMQRQPVRNLIQRQPVRNVISRVIHFRPFGRCRR